MTRTMTAAAILTALLFGAVPAHAGCGWNGATWNALSENGLSLNGLAINGLSLNSLTPGDAAAGGVIAEAHRMSPPPARGHGIEPAATLQIIEVELPAQGR